MTITVLLISKVNFDYLVLLLRSDFLFLFDDPKDMQELFLRRIANVQEKNDFGLSSSIQSLFFWPCLRIVAFAIGRKFVRKIPDLAATPPFVQERIAANRPTQ